MVSSEQKGWPDMRASTPQEIIDANVAYANQLKQRFDRLKIELTETQIALRHAQEKLQQAQRERDRLLSAANTAAEWIKWWRNDKEGDSPVGSAGNMLFALEKAIAHTEGPSEKEVGGV